MSQALKDGEQQAGNWIIWGGCLVTLFFWCPLNDPFNAPKSWLLSIAGSWLFGWIIFQFRNKVRIQPLRWATIFSFTFLIALNISFLFSGNKFISFFGEYTRRTGFLTYFCFVIFFLASSYIFRINNLDKFIKIIIGVGFITSLYGLIQHFHHDFVHWNNPYNPVLGTLGNPDFAASMMAIFLIISFGTALQPSIRLMFRVFAGLSSFLLLLAIIFSQARQGVIESLLGITIISIIWVWQRKKVLSLLFAVLICVISAFGILGMFNQGPLLKYFYKPSISLRGDYWRAGWRMFLHHPFFGVGPDRYGEYFRQYRDATQSRRNGPNFVSNQAHNLPIQMAATGGIIVLIAYLVFTLFILWRGIIALKNLKGSQQILVAIIFAAWISYQTQSIISIDNIGMAIWGYILGGILVGVSIPIDEDNHKAKSVSIIQPMISGLLSLTLMAISALFLGSESSMYSLSRLGTPHVQSDLSLYNRALQKPLSYVLKEPNFIVTTAGYNAAVGNFSVAITQLRWVLARDPRYFDAENLLASIYEFQKNWSEAIRCRQDLTKYDPYNQINLLQLGEDEKASGNLSAARKVIPLINSFAANTPEAKQAQLDLGV